MKKYLVIGNPIDHSLSPKLHNYWIKKNKIDGIYDKKLLNEGDVKNIISQFRKGEIDGINVTVPFKKLVIPFVDELTTEANESQSVNTIYKEKGKVIGHNTDIAGFELGLRSIKQDVKDKKIFISPSSTEKKNNIQKIDKKINKNKRIVTRNKSKTQNISLANIFNNLVIIIISFIALIIILDTFKNNISSYLPILIPLLDNLYLSIFDLISFVKDLFN